MPLYSTQFQNSFKLILAKGYPRKISYRRDSLWTGSQYPYRLLALMCPVKNSSGIRIHELLLRYTPSYFNELRQLLDQH